VSQAASELNLTFVVDEDQTARLVRSLHALLFSGRKPDGTVGLSWRELFEAQPQTRPSETTLPWWRARRDELLALAKEQSPLYVYDEESLLGSIHALQQITAVDRFFYAMKANPNVDVLKTIEQAGFGFECVSPGEIAAVRELGVAPERILFTPNFAAKSEYVAGLAMNAIVTVDNVYVLEKWPELFAGKSIFLRLDPGSGRGHHDHVKTGGQQSKFGIAAAELEKVPALVEKAKAKVVGLHAHAGSGVLEPDAWSETALFLVAAAERFPDVVSLDVGGGLGVPEKPGQVALDLAKVNETLAKVKQAHPGFALWLEPGRFLVAQAGALLGRVHQVKTKGTATFVGTDAGMNSLIRPALYGAYHEIVNLSRLDEKPTMTATIVGPICESGDVLGHGRRIAPAREGDVLLVGTTGAYGRSMSSRYNLREPATERFLRARA
jgi:diaminopimelate decarboxylase/aspartate kinase